MNRKLLAACGAIAILAAIGATTVLISWNPVSLLHGPAWKTAYRNCLGKDAAAPAERALICGSVADAVSDLAMPDGRRTPGTLPSAFGPAKAPSYSTSNSSMDRYEALLARDGRIFRSKNPPIMAGDVSQSIRVGNDRLEVVAGCPDEPEHPDFCQTLVWHGKKLLSDRYVTIMAAFPSAGVPAIVNVTSDGGGNCCLPRANLVDLTGPEPVVMQMPDIGDDLEFKLISPTLLLVSGTNTVETDSNGDQMTTNYLYRLDRKLMTYAPFDGRTDFGQVVNETSGVLLADPASRKPLSDALGDRLKEFRQHMEVTFPGTLVDYRYIVGEGCMAHACNDALGMYIIDIATGDATALWSDGNRPLRAAGKAPSYYPALRDVIEKWLTRAGF